MDSTMPWEDMFTTIAPGRSSDNIANQIMQAVYSGQLSVGDKLPNERELGQLFGVSRSTLREAIRILEAEGMVTVQRGTTGGTFVAAPEVGKVGFGLSALIRFHQATIEDFTEFRQSFEAETAYWAAKRATQEQSDRLIEIVRLATNVALNVEVDWEKFVDLDVSFHEAVAAASGNTIRVAIMLAVHNAFRRTSLSLPRHDFEWRKEQADQLANIAVAIQKHRPDTAKQLMRSHIVSNVALSEEYFAK